LINDFESTKSLSQHKGAIPNNTKENAGQNRSEQVSFIDRFLVGFIQIKGLTQPVPVSGANPDALTFLHGDKMYEYTVFAKVANKEVALKTFFDDLDDKPMEKAKALVEANKGKFRSMRIEKRITPML